MFSVFFMLLFCILRASFNVIERLCGYNSRPGLELLSCEWQLLRWKLLWLEICSKLLWVSISLLVKIRSNMHLTRVRYNNASKSSNWVSSWQLCQPPLGLHYSSSHKTKFAEDQRAGKKASLKSPLKTTPSVMGTLGETNSFPLLQRVWWWIVQA